MSLIQKEIADFSVQCYQNNAFHAVTKADVLGKWSVFFFYPADFTFVCPTELEDLANKYAEFQAAGCEIYAVSCDTHFGAVDKVCFQKYGLAKSSSNSIYFTVNNNKQARKTYLLFR